MLKLRIATAAVLLAVVVAALGLGRSAFIAVAALAFGVAMFEWLRIAGVRDRIAGAVAIGFIALLLIGETWLGSPQGMLLTLICAGGCAVWITLIAVLIRAQLHGVRINAVVSIVLSAVLLSAAWFALLYLHTLGIVMLVSTLAIVWIADITAYFSGRAFGSTKLASRISPGKTWAGVIGAVLGVLVIALIARWGWPQAPLYTNLLLRQLPWSAAMLLLTLLVAFSIAGDLYESLLKRLAGVKDSGGLLPGHGGVLDRIDAVLPVLPAAVLIELFLRSDVI